jgi:DNA-binding response OmpR family regulator
MVGTGLTILVVDDTTGCGDRYALWLEEDHEVLTAADGEAALERLSDRVDLVLLDREMPGPNGLAVAREIRERGFDPYVVMVSSREPDLDLLEYPVDDDLQKPIGAADLAAVVEEYRSREAYRDTLEQFFALTATVATLEASTPRSELARCERYARLRWLVEEKRAEVDRALNEAAPDWSTAFRACGRPAPGSTSGHDRAVQERGQAVCNPDG